MRVSQNYRKRLKAHRLRLFKKLFFASLFPLILVIFLVIIQLSRPSPDEWNADTIILNSIDATTVYRHHGSSRVAQITSNDGRSFVLSQMKPEEASNALIIGGEYEIAYSSEFGRLRIKGISQNGTEIISRSDSASGYKSNLVTIIIFCSAVLLIMLVVFALTVKLRCKDELKNIKRLKPKIKSNSPQPSLAEKVSTELTDEESSTK